MAFAKEHFTPENKELMVEEILPGVWAFDEGGMVTSYLVVGEKSAIQLDAGGTGKDLRGEAKRITGLPTLLALSHGHRDHIASIAQYEKAYASPDEFAIIRANCPEGCPELLPVGSGYRFDLGGRELEVIDFPGHTPGSLLFIDRKNRLCFTGDSITCGPIFMQMPECDLARLLESFKRFETMVGDFDKLLPCHNIYPLPAAKFYDIEALGKKVLSGEAEGRDDFEKPFPGSYRLYMENGCSYFY